MRDGPVHACCQRATATSVGGAYGGRVVHLQPDSALDTKRGDTAREVLRKERRPLPSQDHWRKGLRTYQKPKQARTDIVGRDDVRLQRDREQLLPHLEPKNALRGEEQERCFHRNTTKSAFRDLSALATTKSRVTVVRFQ